MYRIEVDLFGKQNGAEFVDTAKFPGFATRTEALKVYEDLCTHVSKWVGGGRYDCAMVTMYDDVTDEAMRNRTYSRDE